MKKIKTYTVETMSLNCSRDTKYITLARRDSYEVTSSARDLLRLANDIDRAYDIAKVTLFADDSTTKKYQAILTFDENFLQINVNETFK